MPRGRLNFRRAVVRVLASMYCTAFVLLVAREMMSSLSRFAARDAFLPLDVRVVTTWRYSSNVIRCFD